jgi:quinol monooxygenase YgiN
MAAIQAHQTAPHMVEARKQAGDDLEEPPQIFILNEVGGFKR